MGDGLISKLLRGPRNFLGLSSTERRLTLQAWCVLAAFRVRLWVLPASSTASWIRDSAPSAALATEPRVPAGEIARAVIRAARFVPGASCLVQALSGSRLIRRAGGSATIHIGVATGPDGFKAHAWLESEGQVLIGGGTVETYIALERPPSR
jgi:hypothetical protein